MFQNIIQISLSLIVGIFIGWNFHIFYTSIDLQIKKDTNSINKTIAISTQKQNIEPKDNKTKKIKPIHISSITPKKTKEIIKNKIKVKKIDSNESNISNIFLFKKFLYTDNFSEAMALYMEGDEREIKEYKLLLKAYFYDNIEKNPQKIIEDILTYIEIEPNSEDIKIYLSEIYIKQKEFKKALEILFELKNTQDSKTINEKLNLTIQKYIKYLKNSKSYSKLIEFLNEVIERLPNNENYIIQLSQIYSDLNQYQKAKELLEEIDEDSIYYTKVQNTINKMELKSYQYIIPLEKIGSHYAINLTIDNTPLKLLLDTGATYTFINSEKLPSVELGREIVLTTAGGNIIANLAKAESLKIGELELKNFMLTIAPFPQKKEDGLLGMNFFKKFDFKINQDKNILYLNPK
jgi:clan AA aspartic protease (TIGR02281 family)